MINKRAHFSEITVVSIISLICCLFVLNRNQKISKKEVIPRKLWAFYNIRWGNPEVDKQWIGWEQSGVGWEKGKITPPGTWPSIFMPELGLYSVFNSTVVNRHMDLIKKAGIDAIIINWFGKDRIEYGYNGTQGFTNKALAFIIKKAAKRSIKVGVMIPNYDGRTTGGVIDDVKFYLTKYGKMRNILKIFSRPMVFIYDAHALADNFNVTVANYGTIKPIFFASGTKYEDFVVSYENGYAGFLSFFAPDGFTASSQVDNWHALSRFANSRDLFFIPTVTPGYNDNIMYPWNSRFVSNRNSGQYYETRWKHAAIHNPKIIFLNSFNNWIESTNIEPAINHDSKPLNNETWSDNQDPLFYIQLTRRYSDLFKANKLFTL